MEYVGRLLIISGLILIIIGLFFLFFEKIPSGNIGKLPGDIFIKRDNFVIYIPIVTSIVLSIVLTLILNLIFRR